MIRLGSAVTGGDMSAVRAEREPELRRGGGRGRRWKTVPVTVVLPDCSAYFMELREDCKGFDCLAKMCEVLGIVEMDYFGLKFSDRTAGCDAWVNNRTNLKNQLKLCKRPYRLGFRVKFFTDPHLLQQPSTKQAFFKDLRHQLQRGQLTLPHDVKPTVGALTAQVEIGNYSEAQPRSPALVYPAYFPDWTEGIAYHICMEHKKLRGMSKEAAMQNYIEKVSEVGECGVTSYPGFFEGKHVAIKVGSGHVQFTSTERKVVKRIPYYMMTQVSFGSTFFGLQYHSRNEDGAAVDKRLRVTVRNKYIARHLFRAVTEQQVFFLQTTVLPEVHKHTDSHYHKLRKVCNRVLLGREFEPEYYFDILRTKHEAYSHMWQLLHQVQEVEREGEGAVEEEGADNPYATVTIESDDSSSQVDTMGSDKPYWGLSTSSCNLAKDLLAESHLHLSHSTSPLLPSDSLHSSPSHPPLHSSSSSLPCTAAASKTAVVGHSSPTETRLTHAQSEKLRKLLLNIQDERLCQVCMSAPISAVFCPCGHHVTCYGCAKRLVSCPICRQSVGYVQYVYTH